MNVLDRTAWRGHPRPAASEVGRGHLPVGRRPRSRRHHWRDLMDVSPRRRARTGQDGRRRDHAEGRRRRPRRRLARIAVRSTAIGIVTRVRWDELSSALLQSRPARRGTTQSRICRRPRGPVPRSSRPGRHATGSPSAIHGLSGGNSSVSDTRRTSSLTPLPSGTFCAHCLASSLDDTSRIQKPLNSSLASVYGPSVTYGRVGVEVDDEALLGSGQALTGQHHTGLDELLVEPAHRLDDVVEVDVLLPASQPRPRGWTA